MRLSRKFVSLSMLLFTLGVISGTLLIATLGEILGLIVGLCFVVVVLGIGILAVRD